MTAPDSVAHALDLHAHLLDPIQALLYAASVALVSWAIHLLFGGD